MTRVVIVGCGVVGAAIAYELSQFPHLTVTVVEQAAAPAQGCTQAALGVLMGAISRKAKGRNLRWRLASLQIYDRWIPQLAALTGRSLLYNRQGLVSLCFEAAALAAAQSLAMIRAKQGWTLEIWDRDRVAATFPYLNAAELVGAIYSPGDRQLDPTGLTQALVEAATQQGVTFQFATQVQGAVTLANGQGERLQTNRGDVPFDWLVLAAGLGSMPLTHTLPPPVALRPVLGQAARIQLPTPLQSTPAPVISGNDVHLVPLGDCAYWVGATVEFPTDEAPPVASEAAWTEVWEQAIAMCPALQQAAIEAHWSGLRPRPVGRPAPIIEPLTGHPNVLLATGHYRNGVLLAPITAQLIRETICAAAPIPTG